MPLASDLVTSPIAIPSACCRSSAASLPAVAQSYPSPTAALAGDLRGRHLSCRFLSIGTRPLPPLISAWRRRRTAFNRRCAGGLWPYQRGDVAVATDFVRSTPTPSLLFPLPPAPLCWQTSSLHGLEAAV
jgi:hypothetical protein